MGRVCSLLWLVNQHIVYILYCRQCGLFYVYGLCNGNAFAAAVEYRRHFPRTRFPGRHTFLHTYQQLHVHGTDQNVCQNPERLVQLPVEEENVFRIVERGLCVSICILPTSPFREWVWETSHEDLFCQYHVQQIQHLEVVAVGHRLEFCRWMSTHRRLAHYILTTDEAHYIRDGIKYTMNFYSGDRGNQSGSVEGPAST